jgi:hypothetical protein
LQKLAGINDLQWRKIRYFIDRQIRGVFKKLRRFLNLFSSGPHGSDHHKGLTLIGGWPFFLKETLEVSVKIV